jgi:hypothetical protein
MKTAMQELLTYILVDCRNESGAIQFNAHETFNKFLEKEKEQIIDAYYGNIDGVFGYREEGQEYYNQTYKPETI